VNLSRHDGRLPVSWRRLGDGDPTMPHGRTSMRRPDHDTRAVGDPLLATPSTTPLAARLRQPVGLSGLLRCRQEAVTQEIL